MAAKTDKPQLDHDGDGKPGGLPSRRTEAGRLRRKFQFKPVCGMNEAGVDAFISDAEQMDRGTDRFPWRGNLKSESKAAINGMTFMPDVKKRLNEVVVAKAGPGPFNRGPFLLPVS